MNPVASRGRRVTAALMALSAIVLSALLLAAGSAAGAHPPGCGVESGCAKVVGSRWSTFFGASVALPALVVHLVLLLAIAGTGARAEGVRRRAWRTWLVLSAAAAGAAVWFLGLQFGVLGTFCPFCVGAHAAAIVLFALAAFRFPVGRRPVLGLAGAGFALAGGLAFVQGVSVPSPVAPERLDADAPVVRGEGADREIRLPGGAGTLRPADELVLGSPAARRVLVLVSDYCCPHCRATHRWLHDGMKRYPREEFAVLVLPAPLNPDCNPKAGPHGPRYRDACDLARLAIAVRLADPESFPGFDAWLYDPYDPRPLDVARRKAELLVGAEPLAAALSDPRVGEMLRRNVELLGRVGATRLPVLMGEGMAPEAGLPLGEKELFSTLEHGLGIRAADPPK